MWKKSEWGNSRQCVALAASQKYIAWQYGNSHPALQARIKRCAGKPQRALDEKITLILLASFNPRSAKGARNLAICSLALDTGLRCSELCRLLISNTDLEHFSLQVIVKGGQWAAAVFSPQTAAHIQQWLAYRKTVTGPGYLFTNTFTGKGLAAAGLGNIVRCWGKTIGIPHSWARLKLEAM